MVLRAIPDADGCLLVVDLGSAYTSRTDSRPVEHESCVKRTEVLVIGAGVVGVCSAHYLQRAGKQVTVVEKGAVCSGSSHGNGGLLVPSHSVPLAQPGVVFQALRWMGDPESPFYIRPRFEIDLFRWLWRFWRCSNRQHVERAIPILRDLNLSSIELYDELDDELDIDFDLEHRGVLKIFKTNAELDHAAEHCEQLTTRGIQARVVDPREIARLEPNVEIEAIGGVYYDQDAHITPMKFVHGLADVVQADGVDLRTDTEVMGLARQNGRISEVHTTRGDFAPEQVVLAGGAWSPEIVRDLSLHLPIQAGKGYSITFERPEPCPAMPLTCDEARFGITPMGDYLRFAGTLELSGLNLDVDERRIRAILNSVPEYLPQLNPEEMKLVEKWRGLRPVTPDGLPFIGRSSAVDNLIVAAGHAFIGLSLGPVTGKLVSELVAGQTPSLYLSLLRLDRFG